MSEPRRLLEGGSDFERSILGSARDDIPAPGARKKTLVALGLGAGVLGASATLTATTAASTATTAASTTTAAGAKVAASMLVAKWIGIGVVSGLVAVGAAHVARSHAEPPAAPTPAQIAEGAAAQAPARSLAAKPGAAAEQPSKVDEPAKIDEPVKVDEPSKADAPLAPTAAAHARASAEPERSDLAGEVAALDAARVALSSGDASGALRALDAHDRSFPRGMLGPEATVLRIEALTARGDRASATRLAESFLAAHPHSPHAARLRTLLGLTAGEPASP